VLIFESVVSADRFLKNNLASATLQLCFKHFAWSLFGASFQLVPVENWLQSSHKLRFAKLAAVGGSCRRCYAHIFISYFM